MSFVPTYPGVYIREIPSGSRTIIGASTSIAAFVGSFARGPLNTPVRIFTDADFQNNFGGISGDHPASFAVSQFLINGGGRGYAVRVSPDAAAASVTLQNWAAAPEDVLRITAGRIVADTPVDDPGEWGNQLRIDVDYRTADPATQFNLMISEIDVIDGIETALRTEVYRNLTMTAGPQNAIAVVNDASMLVYLDREDMWPLERPAATGYYSGEIGAAALAGLAGDHGIQIDFGTGSEDITVSFAAAPTTLAEVAGVIQNAIRGAFPANRLFSQATVAADGARLRVGVGRASPDYDPETIINIADLGGDTLAATLDLDSGNPVVNANVEQYAAAHTVPVGFQSDAALGTDGSAVDANTLRGDRGARTGFYALDDVDGFNMLSIPDASLLGDVANLAAVMAPAVTYCTEKRAMLFIDPPPGTNTILEAEAWLEEIANAGLRTPNSVAYYPRVRIPDPTDDNRLRDVAPSGSMAGIWSRTDAQTGVWKAPADTTSALRNVLELTHVMTDAENGIINPLGLNALRSFDIPGNVAWGARTLAGADLLASDWKYIPVRRTALFIESSLFAGLQWAVFQPNDEPLWTEIRGAANAFMQGLFRQGAFQGASPREAYVVRCGSDTTTQADINAGIVNVFVGFAPLQPAEFVVVSLQLQLAQAA
ncbi:MAG: phage tail sheath C-terminal domain-containing protein [Pseudomonadota bacterium]